MQNKSVLSEKSEKLDLLFQNLKTDFNRLSRLAELNQDFETKSFAVGNNAGDRQSITANEKLCQSP